MKEDTTTTKPKTPEPQAEATPEPQAAEAPEPKPEAPKLGRMLTQREVGALEDDTRIFVAGPGEEPRAAKLERFNKRADGWTPRAVAGKKHLCWLDERVGPDSSDVNVWLPAEKE